MTKLERKLLQQESALEKLSKEGFDFQCVGPFHYRNGDYDFWPTTGRYHDRVRGYRGRGIPRLLRALRKAQIRKENGAASAGNLQPEDRFEGEAYEP